MLTTKLEAILFAVAKPLAKAQLKKQLDLSEEVLEEALLDLKTRWNTPTSGVHLLEHEEKVQMITNPDMADDVALFLKKEASGPLTRPALETLAVIAYRGPVTKPEIEQVRGVNCSMILRNLMIRGLIDEQQDLQRLQPVYRVTELFLKELGLHQVSELSDFESFFTNERITELMQSKEVSSEEV